MVKNPPANVGVNPGLGRSPGGAHFRPLQSSCLENLTDKGVWQAMVLMVLKESDMIEAT